MSRRPDPETAPGIASAADRLLERPAPDKYLDAWAKALRDPIHADEQEERLPVGIFRLGGERFALATEHIREVHLPAPVCALAGRTNDVFRGLVSLHGHIHLVADVRQLLGVVLADQGEGVSSRMLVVRRAAERWAFEVDEVLDIRNVDAASVTDPQVTVSKAAVHFTSGMIDFGDGFGALLDPERLFAGLARSLV